MINVKVPSSQFVTWGNTKKYLLKANTCTVAIFVLNHSRWKNIWNNTLNFMLTGRLICVIFVKNLSCQRNIYIDIWILPVSTDIIALVVVTISAGKTTWNVTGKSIIRLIKNKYQQWKTIKLIYVVSISILYNLI